MLDAIGQTSTLSASHQSGLDVCLVCRKLTTAPEGEQRPLERLSLLFHTFFRHADFTSSDVAVTIYLANVLKRIERKQTIAALVSAAAAASDSSCARPPSSGTIRSSSSAALQELISHDERCNGMHHNQLFARCMSCLVMPACC